MEIADVLLNFCCLIVLLSVGSTIWAIYKNSQANQEITEQDVEALMREYQQRNEN